MEIWKLTQKLNGGRSSVPVVEMLYDGMQTNFEVIDVNIVAFENIAGFFQGCIKLEMQIDNSQFMVL